MATGDPIRVSIEALRSEDLVAKDAALAELREFLRRTLARGFGRQLSDSDLEDLTQDTMLRVHDKLDSFAGRSKFTTWAASIAVNVALMELRRRKHARVSLSDAIAAGEVALAPAEAPAVVQRRERDEALRQAIDAALTPRQRQALLAELGGLPLVEVARRMGSSRGALYKLLHDARKRLRRHLEGRGLVARDLLLNPGEDAP